jgi:para-nitrobenzyl esterase
VYFWIPGGGNVIQSPSNDSTSGARLSQQSNVVFVSINYRVGEFGWFSHPALRSGKPGDEYDDSGNYGTLDIIKALAWAQDNIEAFGGNPDNVFVSGESAGAFNTLTLLISPAAKSLFHKAMAQSGRQNTYSVVEGDTSANTIIARLLVNDGTAANLEKAEKCRDRMTAKEITAYLRSKTFQEFYSCRSALPFMAAFEDGAVISATGFHSLEDGTYPNKVPVIIGMNKEETKFELFHQKFVLGDDELYGNNELYEAVAVFASDLKKATGCDDLLRKLRANTGQPDVYGYQFCWGAKRLDGKSPLREPFASKLGACHSMDIPFFFNLDSCLVPDAVFTEENRQGRKALTNAIMAYVAQFVRTGDPNKRGPDLPKWEPWSNDVGGPKCILFDVDGDVTDIKMIREELTEEGVRARMDALPEALRAKLMKGIMRLQTSSTFRLLEHFSTK